MMILDQLKLQYPTQNIPPYGECVVIPGIEFNPDWEVYLGDEGYKCFNTALDQKLVTLVPLKKSNSGEGAEKEVYAPVAKPEANPKSKSQKAKHNSRFDNPWKADEDQFLIQRMNTLVSKGSVAKRARILLPEFPNRSANGLSQRYFKLAGPVRKGRKKRSDKGSKTSGKATSDTCPDCGLPKDLCCCDEEKKGQQRIALRQVARKERESSDNVADEPTLRESDLAVKLLEEIRDLLTPDTYSFNHHCHTCRTSGVASGEEKVWEFCPVCGKPLLVWNVVTE